MRLPIRKLILCLLAALVLVPALTPQALAGEPSAYYGDEPERAAALSALSALEQAEGKPACVAVEPFRGFYPAELYHQDYDLKNPDAFRRELMESGRMACPRRRKKKA